MSINVISFDPDGSNYHEIDDEGRGDKDELREQVMSSFLSQMPFCFQNLPSLGVSLNHNIKRFSCSFQQLRKEANI